MDGHARPRPVEIDHVEPRRPRSDELLGHGDRVVREGRLPREVALHETDDASATQIDRGQDLEGACQPVALHVSVLARYYDSTTEHTTEAGAAMADDWRTPDANALFRAILSLEDTAEAERFFRDLCTLNELRDLAQRWAVVRLLDSGKHYAEISRETGASTATITRIASWLNHGEGGYREMLEKTRTATAAAPDGGR